MQDQGVVEGWPSSELEFTTATRVILQETKAFFGVLLQCFRNVFYKADKSVAGVPCPVPFTSIRRCIYDNPPCHNNTFFPAPSASHTHPPSPLPNLSALFPDLLIHS